MSTEIDQNVVAMKFDNAQFEAGVKKSLSTLDELKRGMNFEGAAKGLQNLDMSAKRFSLQGMAQAVEGLASKFTALNVVGVAALANLTERAMGFGERLASNFFGSAKSGLEEYETGLNSVQTIMANTGLKGEKGLGKVNGTLKLLNDYSDKTIYNFAEMARNVGTFTAAGVGLDKSAKSIKGIANLAALSGSNSTQAATAMYQLSQAISSGTVRLIDWNSVQNAGMGGKVFQEALKTTARVHGVNVDAMIKKQGSFRDSLQEGWLTSKIMVETLNQFTGDMTDEQLKSLGYSDKQIKKIQEQAKTAQDAATKVKTFTQLLGTLQEAMGSGWAQSWQLIIGDFGEAKKLWTFINDNMSKMIQDSAEARNAQLSIWHKDGGYLAVMDAIKNAFTAYLKVVKPIREAWNEVFPPSLGVTLIAISVALRDFTAGLIISDEAAANLKMVAKALFGVLKTGVAVVSGVFGLLSSLAGFLWSLGGSLLSFLDPVFTFIKSIFMTGQATGDAAADVEAFFKTLQKATDIFQPLLTALRMAQLALDDFLNGGDLAAEFRKKLEPIMLFFEGLRQMLVVNLGGTLAAIPEAIATGWQTLAEIVTGVWNFISGIVKAIQDLFGGIGDGIAEGLQNLDLSMVLNIINGVLLGGIVVAIVKFIRGISKVTGGIAEALTNLSSSFDALTGVLKTMQNEIKARIIMEIAASVLLLALAVSVLSQINPERLLGSVAALGALFAELLGTIAIFAKITKDNDLKKISVITVMLISISAALRIMAGAVAVLGKLDQNQLAQGLVGITVLLFGLVMAAQALSSMDTDLVRSAAGLAVMAGALLMLVGVVAAFGLMSWDVLIRGFSGLAAALILMVGSAVIMSKFAKDMVLSAVGLMAMSAAINMLLIPLTTFGLLPMNVLLQGFISIVALMGVMVGAAVLLSKFAPQMVMAAVGMIAMAGAIGIMTNAVLVLGLIPMDVLIQGLLAVGALLAALVIAANAMNAALPGAAAMLAVAGSLLILAFAVGLMAAIPTDRLVTALMALIIVIGAFAIAATVLTPVIPALIGLAGAIALIGVAILAAGLGMMLFAVAAAMMGPALQLLAQGLIAFGENWQPIANAIPLITGVGVALGVVGAGALLAGIGFLALGLGLIFAAGGLLALAFASVVGVTGISAFILGVQKVFPMIPQLAALGATLIAFGAGALAAGVGMLLLAGGTLLMSVALAALLAAEPALAIIPAMVKTFSDMVLQAPLLIAVGGALAALGAGALAAGVGIGALGAASMLLAAALIGISVGASLMSTAVTAIVAAFVAFAPVAGQAVLLTSAISGLAAALTLLGASGVALGLGMTGAAVGVAALSAAAVALAIAVALMLAAFNGLGEKVSKAMAGVPEAIGTQSEKALGKLNDFADGVRIAMPDIIDSGTKAITSFTKSMSAQAGVDKKTLYDAGEKLGKAMNDGMVKALKKSDNIEEEARRLARKALEAMKKELDSHSPSRETEKIGNWYVEGFSGGISKMGYLAERSAGGVAKGAMSALKDALEQASTYVMSDTDLTPTIKPVLDLTDIRNGANAIDKAIGTPQFSVSSAYAVASDILQAKAAQEAEAAVAAGSQDMRPIEIKYEQYNTSPKALSEVEIYRQTNNQISTIKGVLESANEGRSL